MAECEICITPEDASGECLVCITPSDLSALDCVRELAWSPEPVVIPRSCDITGMTDAEARDHTFSITNALPAGATGTFDELGNYTYTPAPSQQPMFCGRTSVVLLVAARS